MEHPVDATFPTSHITRELVQQTLTRFQGEIQQVPPAYSACKVDGKRAYDMMRGGSDVQLKAKGDHIAAVQGLHADGPSQVNLHEQQPVVVVPKILSCHILLFWPQSYAFFLICSNKGCFYFGCLHPFLYLCTR